MVETGRDRNRGLIKHIIERSGTSFVRTLFIDSKEYVSSIEAKADPGLDPNAGWWQSFLRGSRCTNADHARPNLRVVDAFCGSGGLSLGVALAATALGCAVEFA